MYSASNNLNRCSADLEVKLSQCLMEQNVVDPSYMNRQGIDGFGSLVVAA